MKIYTKTGDAGETDLFGGERVAKDDLRVEAYGAVDEASAALGLAATCLEDAPLRQAVLDLQAGLFLLGADLATPIDSAQYLSRSVTRIDTERVEWLERQIDAHETELEPLRSFIFPGGTPAAAALHLARTVIRRAERRAVALLRADPERTNPEVVPYLNRLGDLLFVLARVANARAGIPDVPWITR